MDFFGLDIGSHTIKVVQLAKRKNKYQLLAFGSIPSTTKGLFSEAESDLNALAEKIKILYKETKIKTKNVVTALPQSEVFTRVVTLPSLTEEELTSSLRWEAEQYVPIPLEEVRLTHQIVGRIKENGEEKIEVLLAAAPNNLIEKTIKVLKLAGLNPLSIETEILALARSLVSPSFGTMLIVDLGAKATDLAIVENGQVVFVHSLPTGGEALTRAIGYELNLEISQAEAYKKAYGVDPQKLEGKIGQVISPVLEQIIEEMEKAIQFYSSRQKMINGVIITGGTAEMPEITSVLAERLNLEVQIGNPFVNVVEDSLLTKIPSSDLPLYAIAVGLAMKEID